MKIYEIDWFKDFKCLEGRCPQSCCRGWVIPLSDRDCERFAQEKGMVGAALFFAMGGRTRAKFNADSGNCLFHGRDGLCILQKKKGHEFIPWTCQSFPRFYRNYGDFEERCLNLSCIGAAELFVKNRGNLAVSEKEDDPVTRECATNDDKEYLDFLLRQRKEMTDVLAAGLTGKTADALFLYAVKCQDMFAQNEEAAISELSFKAFYDELPDKEEYISYPLSPEVLEAFLGSSLCHPKLRRVNPKLYGMFSKAKKYIKRCGTTQKQWREKVTDFLDREKLANEVAGCYLSYYLYQYYLRAYETYSFRRQVALGLCHLNMVILLLMAREAGEASSELIADTIAAYNRRAYFNDDIQDEMYRIYERNYAIIKRSGQ